MANHTLLKEDEGSTLVFYLDTSTAEKGELKRLKDRGWVEEPGELRGVPPEAVLWEGGTPKLDAGSVDGLTEARASERRRYSLMKKHPAAQQLEQIWKTFEFLVGEGVNLPPETLTMMNEILGD